MPDNSTRPASPDATPHVLGHVARTLRFEAGVTLRGLAQATGITHVSIGRLERGLWAPSARELAAIFGAIADAQREVDGRCAISETWWAWVPGMLMFDGLGNTHRLTESDDIDGVLMMTVGLHGFALPVMDDPQTSRLANELLSGSES